MSIRSRIQYRYTVLLCNQSFNFVQPLLILHSGAFARTILMKRNLTQGSQLAASNILMITRENIPESPYSYRMETHTNYEDDSVQTFSGCMTFHTGFS